MSNEEIKKVNTDDFKEITDITSFTIEEQEALNYYNETSAEVSFETDIDGEKFLEALGITKEEDFEKHCYRIITLLKLIEKQQKEIERHKVNFETLSADIIQVKKDLGLSEETIIADEMVIEIKKKFVSKEKIDKLEKKYVKKCAVLPRNASVSQWYTMGKNIGRTEAYQELLEE